MQVKFHFPEPTELVPPLIQLIDVSFKYPGRDDFGLQVHGAHVANHGSELRRQSDRASERRCLCTPLVLHRRLSAMLGRQ